MLHGVPPTTGGIPSLQICQKFKMFHRISFKKQFKPFSQAVTSFNQYYFVGGDGKEWDVSACMRFGMTLNVNQIYLEFLKTRTILPATQTQLPVDCLTFKIAIFILPLKCWTLNLAAVLWSNDQSPCRGLQQDWKGNS